MDATIRRFEPWAVALLLAAYFLMALTASRIKSPAFDELAHLTSGYSAWETGDLRLDPANGDFPKRWAALPLLISEPKLSTQENTFWRSGDAAALGYGFFFESGNSPARLLLQGRAMIALLGCVLGLLVYSAAKNLFGIRSGLLSLLLFAFAPEMLAHGSLVTADLAVSLALFGGCWGLWQVLHRVTPGRLALSLLAVGLAVPCKLSGLALVPVAAALAVARLWAGGSIVWAVGRPRRVVGRRRIAALCLGLLAIHLAVAWTAIWAFYDFRFTASSAPQDHALTFLAEPRLDALTPPTRAAVQFFGRHHLLPEGFLHGTEVLAAITQSRVAYLDGEWSLQGWRRFFPRTFWLKTSPALLVLSVFALVGWAIRSRDRAGRHSWYRAIPLFALPIIYGLLAIAQNLNIGHRHILPLYPCLYVLAGAVLAGRWRWPAGPAIVALGCGLWLVTDSFLSRPNYLAYFNELAGGSSEGYHHLVDSSLDWGMDLPGLKQWIDRRGIGADQLYFAYFGTGHPESYGIQSHRLPGYPDWRAPSRFALQEGYYAISATLLESTYTVTPGPWTPADEENYQLAVTNVNRWEIAGRDHQRGALLKEAPADFWEGQERAFDLLRFGRLCAWLRHHRPPEAEIGRAILIWQLRGSEIHEALFGAPPEQVNWTGE